MAVVVPAVARFAVEQELEGRQVINVLDYRIDTTGSTMSRADAVDAQAGSIFGQWANHIMSRNTVELKLNAVSYVDLDSASGVTGSRVDGEGFSSPVAGTSAGSALPANTALLVTKRGPSQRGFRNGRMFIAGGVELMTIPTDGNRLDTATRNAYQTALNSFLTDTNELDQAGTAFQSFMVIVHVTARDTAGNPTAGVSTDVDSLSLDALLATQRRRLRG